MTTAGARTSAGTALLLLLAAASALALSAGEGGDRNVQYGHDVWDVNRGLSAFAINAITQSPDGYIWLGTDDGLFRFDGVRFSQFNTSNTPSLSHNNVSALCVQQDSSLWIASNGGGLSRYRHGEFTAFGAGEGLTDNQLLSLAASPGGGLWVGTASSGLQRLANGSFRRFYRDSLRTDWLVYSLQEAGGDTLFAGFGGQLAVKYPGANSLTTIGSVGSNILSIRKLRDGSVVLGAMDGVYLFDGASLRPFPVPEIAAIPSAWSILEDHEGNLWFGTEGHGLYRYSQGTLVRLGADNGVLSDRILCMREDAEQNLWIGTRGGGLLRLRRSTVAMLPTSPVLPSGQISVVLERAKGEIWIGTRNAGAFEIRGGRLVRQYAKREGLADNFVRCLFADASGNVWIGSQNGFQVLRPGSGANAAKVQPVTVGGGPLLSVRMCIEDRDGTIWIGSSADGVYKVRRGSFLPWRVPREVSGEYGPVRVMKEDRQGRIWVGTRGGLAVIQNDTMKRFTSANGIPVREIFSLHEDDQGAIWIGTYGDGLYRLKNGVMFRCTKHDGLFDDVIYTILDDGFGSYWMSCNRGIFRVSERELNDLADGKIRSVSSTSFGTADGMKNVECNGGSQPSGWKMEDGRLLFATMDGVALVRPGQVETDSRDPVPVVEEFIAGDRTVRCPAAVRLEPGTRKFDAQYTGLSLVIPERIEFRYILEGFDEHWIDAGTTRKVSYTNLPPGEYVLKIVARHPEREWSARTASLAVTVLPHVWETAWFRAIAIAAVFLCTFLLARFFATRALKRKLRDLEAQRSLDRERTRISQDMHDEVGASLTQIAILSELLQRNIGQKDAAETYLRKISATAQGVVESLDAIVWFINPKHDTLESLLFFIREHLTDFFESAEIECRFELPEAIAPLPLSADARRDIFMAVKEAATNVVKHSDATAVLVRVQIDKGAVELRIEDNGRGMGEEQRSAFGNGIENMKRRMRNIGGTCDIDSVQGRGTTVTMRTDARRR